VLNSPRFAICAPAVIHAQLLDEGRYVASVRTMYRLLQHCDAVRERRNQLRHPEYTKPELLAVMPNQVWSWDITKLMGPVRATCFHLYVILDIFSRYVIRTMRQIAGNDPTAAFKAPTFPINRGLSPVVFRCCLPQARLHIYLLEHP